MNCFFVFYEVLASSLKCKLAIFKNSRFKLDVFERTKKQLTKARSTWPTDFCLRLGFPSDLCRLRFLFPSDSTICYTSAVWKLVHSAWRQTSRRSLSGTCRGIPGVRTLSCAYTCRRCCCSRRGTGSGLRQDTVACVKPPTVIL